MTQGFIKRMMGDTSLLMCAGIIVQLINILAYPVLTRFYSAADFGVFAAVLGLATVIGSAICLRLDMIFQLIPKDDENDLLRSAFTISLSLAGLVFGALLIASDWVLPWVAGDYQDRIAPFGWAALIAGLGLLIGWSALGKQIKSKAVQYGRLSVAQVLRAVAAIGTQVVVAYVWPSPIGLFFGFALGLLVFIAFTLTLPKTGRETPLRFAVLSTLAHHKTLIRVDTVNVLISAMVMAVYPLVILSMFGATAAGYFAIASRFSFIPVEFMGAAISTVFFQRFSESFRNNKGAIQLFWGTLVLGLITGTTVGLVFWFGAGWFVGFLFESAWAPTAGLIIALIPTMVVRFYIGCVGSAPLVMKRPVLLLIWNLSQIVIVGACAGLTQSYALSLRDFLIMSGVILFAASILYIGTVASLLHRSVTLRGGSNAE